MEKRCFNCGCILDKDNISTDEHIPMQGLYCVLKKQYSGSPKKVFSCYTCNHLYSNIEEEFRNFVIFWLISEDINVPIELIGKVFRSPKFQKEVQRLESGAAIYNIDAKKYEDVHIKNFKGLFYDKYKYPLPTEYRITVYADISNDLFFPNIPVKLKELIRDHFDCKNSDVVIHEDIFQYEIGEIPGIGMVCSMIYYKKLFALVIAQKAIR